ncbi:MAG: DUF5915 domain-containing protein [Anaerovorax sp.]|nr:DUF5915 domain-containing protein [Anaerovorax sp.]
MKEILIDGKYEALISDMVDLIKEELNVKEVVFESKLDEFINYTLKPNFKVAGPVLGGKIKNFTGVLMKQNAAELVSMLEQNESIDMEIDGEMFAITKEFIDVKISAKEGFTAAMENNVFTILETTITEELMYEGLARELISKVQQMRKQKDFEMMDHIHIFYHADEEVKKAIEKYGDYIKSETLAEKLIAEDKSFDEYDLNGHKTGINVERI